MKNSQKGSTTLWVSLAILVVLVTVIFIVGARNNSQTSQTQGMDYPNTKPMYGALNYGDYITNRGSERQKADDSFLKEIIGIDGSTKAAFKDAILQAWSYVVKKDVDTAMKRCNQAWLIDNTNFNVYWCYGSILDLKQDYNQSVLYFDKAISMYSTSTEFYADDYLPLYRDASQAFIHLSIKYLATDPINAKKYAVRAVGLLSESLKDKNLSKKEIPVVMFMLAVAYFDDGSYSDARRIYADYLNEYPEYAKSDVVIKFDEALKNKGF